MSIGFQSFPIQAAKEIRMLVLDVDGVLTAGQITMDDQGEESKSFNVRDGHGLKMLQRAGVQVAILTGRTSNVVLHRARDLGIEHVIQGSLLKADGLEELCASAGIAPESCAYMGDDMIDLPAMRKCGLTMAPKDAHRGVLKTAQWVSDYNGGHGAVRQACEGLILASGDWPKVIETAYGLSPEDCGWSA
ncbi:MAG: HAD-IIIA family hydrolase [Mariprofundaceae bacterium]